MLILQFKVLHNPLVSLAFAVESYVIHVLFREFVATSYKYSTIICLKLCTKLQFLPKVVTRTLKMCSVLIFQRKIHS